jgi:hypothetical protein
MSHHGSRVLIVGSALAALALGGTAEAARVLVFNSTRYVDSNQGPGYPEGSQESDNVQASLAAMGHTVATIAGVNDPVGTCGESIAQPGTLLASAAEYASALAANDVFLIPEQESWCYLPGDLLGNQPVVAAWRNWVGAGGALIIHSSEEAMHKVDDLFAVVFGFRAGATSATGVTTTRRPAAAGTAFANAPGVLPAQPSTGLLPLGTLPAGAISIYDDGGRVSVAILPFGSGKIIFLGWDWTKSRPPFADGQDGGWQQVLAAAVAEAIRDEPPPPPPSFADVPPGHWARQHIQSLAAAGVTAGCGGNNFCPASPVTRAEMAVFLLRGRHGAGFAPPPASGIFADVPSSYWAAAWIEQLAEEGIGAGCAAGRYCPDAAVTRAQMAVFLVRAISPPGYTPPAPSGMFADVPRSHWAAGWIEQLARTGITAGCGGGRFCPEAPVTRAEMAVFLVTAFDLGP